MLFYLFCEFRFDGVIDKHFVSVFGNVLHPDCVVTRGDEEIVTFFVENALVCTEILQHKDNSDNCDEIHDVLQHD